MEYGMNNTDKGIWKYWKESFPSATLSTKSPTRTAMGSNMHHQNDRPVTLPEPGMAWLGSQF